MVLIFRCEIRGESPEFTSLAVLSQTISFARIRQDHGTADAVELDHVFFSGGGTSIGSTLEIFMTNSRRPEKEGGKRKVPQHGRIRPGTSSINFALHSWNGVARARQRIRSLGFR